MAGTQITNIATKQDLMCGANFLNVAYTGSGDAYTVSGMIECAGAWYRFVDEPVTVTTSDYIKIVPSTGTATLAAITSFSGVAFDTDKNGYYVTGTNERVFAYRDLTTTIFLMQNQSQNIPDNVIVGGNIATLGNVSSVGSIQYGTKIIGGTALNINGTGADIFSTFNTLIAVTGESMYLNAGIRAVASGNNYLATKISRSSSTAMQLFCFGPIGATSAFSSFSVTSTDATQYTMGGCY